MKDLHCVRYSSRQFGKSFIHFHPFCFFLSTRKTSRWKNRQNCTQGFSDGFSALHYRVLDRVFHSQHRKLAWHSCADLHIANNPRETNRAIPDPRSSPRSANRMLKFQWCGDPSRRTRRGIRPNAWTMSVERRFQPRFCSSKSPTGSFTSSRGGREGGKGDSNGTESSTASSTAARRRNQL